MPKPFLTEQHKAFIKANYLKLSGYDMAKKFGCSSSVVNGYKRENGLITPKSVTAKLKAGKMTGRTSFTPEMDAFIKENYLKMPVKAMGRKIDKSFTAIALRLKKLGLEIPKELREQRKKRGQFKEGFVPKNKGLKLEEFMTPENAAKFRSNSFKKGNTPHNAKYNGYERIQKDGYIEVRVSRGNYQFKHRLIWEKANGPIPEDSVLIFKDGNKQNITLDNLEVITKAQHMTNNTIARYPKELRQSFKLIKQLNKQL